MTRVPFTALALAALALAALALAALLPVQDAAAQPATSSASSRVSFRPARPSQGSFVIVALRTPANGIADSLDIDAELGPGDIIGRHHVRSPSRDHRRKHTQRRDSRNSEASLASVACVRDDPFEAIGVVPKRQAAVAAAVLHRAH